MDNKEITDYIFIGAEPCKADAIFVVGGSLPDAARLAADLYHRDFAHTVIIGGKYSVKRNSFPLPEYETEYDFYKDILLKSGVRENDIYGERESGYTKQNAEFAKQIVDENGLIIKKAIIVCKSFHAKRCLLLYQMYFPDVIFTVVTFDGFDISKDNWYQTEYGKERVMGELQRIKEQCKIKQIGLKNSIDVMTKAIVGILADNAPSVYLYGSVVLDDFRPGWSDIDLLVLTEKQISSEQAKQLVQLRRELTAREPENPYYCLFEGGMLRLSALLSDTEDTVVYWGTSGERVTNRYDFDSFSKKELLENGVLLYGIDVRNYIDPPTFDDLRADIRRHYETIRKYGSKTARSLYSFGWLLDISRCIYTLRTGKIIAKTKAGEWALEYGLCPDPAALETALRVRNTPELFDNDESLQHYAEKLGKVIQAYADVLEKELYGSF